MSGASNSENFATGCDKRMRPETAALALVPALPDYWGIIKKLPACEPTSRTWKQTISSLFWSNLPLIRYIPLLVYQQENTWYLLDHKMLSWYYYYYVESETMGKANYIISGQQHHLQPPTHVNIVPRVLCLHTKRGVRHKTRCTTQRRVIIVIAVHSAGTECLHYPSRVQSLYLHT